MIHSSLYVLKTGEKGRGVFTSAYIKAGTVIELSPVIVMTSAERVLLDQTLLHDYIFEWGPKQDRCCMALGYVPIYNHSYKSNAEYFMDFEKEEIEVKTVRDVEAGEEVTINYNGDWDNEKKVWFEVRG
ncbi:MAG: SET domain-containing protein-lysine N-methyltransferase [Ginsengibacter sp.]